MSMDTDETDPHQDLFAYDRTDAARRQARSALESVAPRV